MQIYKVYKGKIESFEVGKESKEFYYFKEHRPMAFGCSTRVEKKYACLTPQEALQEAMNSRLTMRGAFQDKLAAINAEIEILETLRAALI